MSAKVSSKSRHVLFLDGDCVFCQKSATLLHQIDRRGRLYYAPLQGETASVLPSSWRELKGDNNQATGAAVLTEAWQTDQQVHWRGADAILRALYLAGGVFVIFWPLHLLPRWFKSGLYQLIARNRHRLQLGKDTCSLPNAKFQEHLLP